MSAYEYAVFGITNHTIISAKLKSISQTLLVENKSSRAADKQKRAVYRCVDADALRAVTPRTVRTEITTNE